MENSGVFLLLGNGDVSLLEASLDRGADTVDTGKHFFDVEPQCS